MHTTLSKSFSFYQVRFGLLFAVIYSIISAFPVFVVTPKAGEPIDPFYGCIFSVGSYLQHSCRYSPSVVILNLVWTVALIGIASLYLYLIRKELHVLFPILLFILFPIISFSVFFALFVILIIASGGA